jgi:phenylpropionate dioxygenase-like ring-hydroxylating dioxygenase large terminal subunit
LLVRLTPRRNVYLALLRGASYDHGPGLNVCRHRGSTLCLTDSGDVGRSIRCPYHAWTYRLDGSLMSAPNWSSMAAADKADFGLHPVHLGQWHGMVWLNLAGGAPVTYDTNGYLLAEHKDSFSVSGSTVLPGCRAWRTTTTASTTAW